MKKFFNVKVPPQEKQPSISTTAIASCLYERKQPVFIDVDTLGKSGVKFGGFNSHLCKFSEPKFRNPLHMSLSHDRKFSVGALVKLAREVKLLPSAHENSTQITSLAFRRSSNYQTKLIINSSMKSYLTSYHFAVLKHFRSRTVTANWLTSVPRKIVLKNCSFGFIDLNE